ncbi:flagellar hook-length control protein FliK [Tepidimonas taiwanensis]|uniref:flagellar hook-length control protein FliK n=1 Tax=Tepidimonas taiwanensis TaxID=307486 RepID=UPI0007347AE8|nr:flagellar hook-length control protein FliK [Tepidimonas taiwanensis]
MKTEVTATPAAHAHAHGPARAGRAQPATPDAAGDDPFADLLAGLFAEADTLPAQDETDTTTATADGVTPPGIAPWTPPPEVGQPVADAAEAGDPAADDASAGRRSPADPTGTSATVGSGQPASAQPFGAWVSTVARGKGRAGPAVRGMEANARDTGATTDAATPATGPGRHGERTVSVALMPPPMIAVAMAEMAPPGLAPDQASRDRRGDDITAKGAAGWGDAPAGASSEAPAATEAAAAWQQALGEAFDSIGAQISLWAAGKAQRASFSVEEGLDDPLAVEVTVSDGVAQLSFRTDDGALRQMIQAQAPGALADALARAGLALGQLDVGAHTARERQGAPADAHPAKRTTLTLTAGAEGTAVPGLARPMRSTGGVGLDVYA